MALSLELFYTAPYVLIETIDMGGNGWDAYGWDRMGMEISVSTTSKSRVDGFGFFLCSKWNP